MTENRFENARFVILGSSADAELGREVSAVSPTRCLNLAGSSSLPEMVEWVRMSRCMVTNDTGPMHVAAALKKPIIALFGPTDPKRTGPYEALKGVQRINLPCIPCMKSTCTWPEPMACLKGISPSSVFSVLEQQLAE